MAIRKLVYVKTSATNDPASVALKYGYKTTEEFSKSTFAAELGITEITDTDGGILGAIFGSNRPRPARASKKYSQGNASFSSYCSDANIQSARKKGWSILPSKKTALALQVGGLSTAVFVPITTSYGETFKYAWKMSTKLYNKLSSGANGLTDLGIEIVAGNDIKDCWLGINNFKPGLASKRIGTSTVRTFYDPTKTDLGSKGWEVQAPSWIGG